MRSINNEKGLPRREYWQELVSQQEKSGLSVHAFCKQRDVTEASFYNWRKQLRNNTGVGFALAQGKADKPKAPVELVLATAMERAPYPWGEHARTARTSAQTRALGVYYRYPGRQNGNPGTTRPSRGGK